MKLFKSALLAIVCLAVSIPLRAQEDTTENIGALQKRIEGLEKIVGGLDNFTISGYFQMQYIEAQTDATVRIGGPNENPGENFSRIGIRRSRLKFTYERGIGSAVFQLDFSERGTVIRDAYLKFKDPWIGTCFFQTGIFFRPFGHEVRYSSGRRETPERSRIILTLFPNERDLGAMVQLRTKQSSPLSFLLLEGALIAGNGVNQEIDSRRDFLGHIAALPRLGGSANLRFGLSYYRGSVFQGTENVYTMAGDGFVLNSNLNNRGSYAKREYLGGDVQLSFSSLFGRSQLRTEYIFGKQPGSISTSVSPNIPRLPTHDTYIRNFDGGYITFVQDIGKLPFAAFVNYDWYDPNTDVEGDRIGLNNTTSTDIKYNSLGFGLIWKLKRDLELTAYYLMNKNETTINIPDFSSDRKDNLLTFTLLFRY